MAESMATEDPYEHEPTKEFVSLQVGKRPKTPEQSESTGFIPIEGTRVSTVT